MSAMLDINAKLRRSLPGDEFEIPFDRNRQIVILIRAKKDGRRIFTEKTHHKTLKITRL
jgi:hypothetical protein